MIWNEICIPRNNIRDLETDKKAGIVTMAILLGKKNARSVYTLLLVLPYIMLSLIAPFHSAFVLLPLLSIPLACKLNSDCCHGNLAEIPQKTAMVNLLFGILYVCGLALARWAKNSSYNIFVFNCDLKLLQTIWCIHSRPFLKHRLTVQVHNIWNNEFNIYVCRIKVNNKHTVNIFTSHLLVYSLHTWRWCYQIQHLLYSPFWKE